MHVFTERTVSAVRELWREKQRQAAAGEYIEGAAYIDLVLGLVATINNLAARNLELQAIANSHLEATAEREALTDRKIATFDKWAAWLERLEAGNLGVMSFRVAMVEIWREFLSGRPVRKPKKIKGAA